MRAMTDSRARRTIGRIRHIWGELEYAQRRLFEIRTGVPSLPRDERQAVSGGVDQLEALWAYSELEPADDTSPRMC